MFALQTFNNSQGAIFMAGGAVAGRITGCANIAITGLSSAVLHFQDRIMVLRNIQELKRDTGEFHCVQV